ncbi:uncharacterized protein N7482_002736 [Penicillium canariense]|uniref:Uncharacterized protein n=1 Tax=Penicillium canariense TaxID=189055 RepID=A0A9W9IG12_9EURO|nr:uncharacterized protein N7482_002736 [Penicillium canariense]KAJ5176859.1 hypothetical protein N7482_002736 [Penicillium canariense]
MKLTEWSLGPTNYKKAPNEIFGPKLCNSLSLVDKPVRAKSNHQNEPMGTLDPTNDDAKLPDNRLNRLAFHLDAPVLNGIRESVSYPSLSSPRATFAIQTTQPRDTKSFRSVKINTPLSRNADPTARSWSGAKSEIATTGT